MIVTREAWNVRKPAVRAAGGLVASQHHRASEIGAAVLRSGGNAVDAAVAAGFAVSVLEPWMSGIGGGGWMLVYSARDRKVSAVDFSMIAPRGLDPADYPLTGRPGGDLFGWPEVVEDRNMRGPYSVAVPGQVAGMALALDSFGSRSWAETLAPAIALAEEGILADWYVTMMVATAAAQLAMDPGSREVYLPGGMPPAGEFSGAPPRLPLDRLAATLRSLAERGARDFYEGGIAEALCADIQQAGGRLAVSDLAGYRARLLDADAMGYRDVTVHTAPGLTAGPTMRRALAALADRLEPRPGGTPDAEAVLAYAECLRAAYAHRFDTMGDTDPAATEPSCTTHLTVVDRDGNMVALTQTLLSIFGSKFTSPQTGVLLNNGINWFDPRPGGPNSMAGGKRPLTNMCPTVLTRDGTPLMALGASGGRRIMPAVYQLLSFVVDYGMTLDQAFHQPRIDVSGVDAVTANAALPEATLAQLEAALPVPVIRAQPVTYPALYACPNAVRWREGEANAAAAYVNSPWAAAVAE